MNNNMLIVSAFLLIIGLGAGYVLGKNQTTAPVPATHMMQGGAMMQNNIDQHFIVQMIPHHEGAIEMAKIALERSKRPEILSLAKGIIEAQERENTDMRTWYEAWFGSTPPENVGMGMGNMHMGGMEGDVSVLRAVSAAEFDREFIEQMIPHHEMAIMMANMLAAVTERDEMKTLADNIITSQSREIDMMRGWLTSWYN